MSGPELMYDSENFGGLTGEVTGPIDALQGGGFRYWNGHDYTEQYNSQVREITQVNDYYNNNTGPDVVRVANIIVPNMDQIDRPGPEYANEEEIGDDVPVSKTKRFLRVFRKQVKGDPLLDRNDRDALRAARKALRNEIKSTRRLRRAFYKDRIARRVNYGVTEKTADINQQKLDVHGDGVQWEERRTALTGKRGQVLSAGTDTFRYGYLWAAAGAPLSTISFTMGGVLPVDKPFMDRSAYYRVNHTLMQHTDKEIAQQKLDAMAFFEEQFGLTFKSAGKPIQGEEDDGSLEIPGLATLRRYAISPSLKTRVTTAVSDNHPIEANEKVHEAGWIVTVIARRGANLGGIFGGDKGKAVKPGTSMSYGYWVFMNPEFQEDHAIIHFESSEPSFFGGASGHVAHHYVIHDLSVIDGIHIKKGAWGTATSITTERKILGNKKKLGDLYGKTEAHVQTTINVTHF